MSQTARTCSVLMVFVISHQFLSVSSIYQQVRELRSATPSNSSNQPSPPLAAATNSGQCEVVNDDRSSNLDGRISVAAIRDGNSGGFPGRLTYLPKRIERVLRCRRRVRQHNPCLLPTDYRRQGGDLFFALEIADSVVNLLVGLAQGDGELPAVPIPQIEQDAKRRV